MIKKISRKYIFIFLTTFVFLNGCTQNNQPPAWMVNFSEVSIMAVQPSSKNAEQYGRYFYKPSLELDRSSNNISFILISHTSLTLNPHPYNNETIA